MAKTITIAGCGNLGKRLAYELDRAGYEVAVIDKDESNLVNLQAAGFSGSVTVGVPIDREDLENTCIEGCDIFIAATDNDNENVVASQIAKTFYNIKEVLTCVSDMHLCDFYNEMGLLTICPTRITIGTIRSVIDKINEKNNLCFGAKNFNFYYRPVEREMVGKRLSEVAVKSGESIFAVMHDKNNVEMYNPGIKIRLVESDTLIIARAID